MMATSNRCRPSGHVLLALLAAVFGSGGACRDRDAKAVAVVRSELALLKPPGGSAPTEPQVGLGEMYAEGGQKYCVSDDKAGQIALDAMMRNAGWEPVSSSTTAEGTVWRYHKGEHQGLLTLETQPQPCGRRFRVDVLEPL